MDDGAWDNGALESIAFMEKVFRRTPVFSAAMCAGRWSLLSACWRSHGSGATWVG